MNDEIHRLFDALPGICVLIKANAPHYTIVAVTEDLLQMQTAPTTKEYLIGKDFFEPWPYNNDDNARSDQVNLRASFNYVIAHKVAHHLPVQRYNFSNEDGTLTEKHLTVTNKPVFAANGEVTYIVHTYTDVTEQVSASRRHEESEAHLKLLSNTVPAMIFYLDTEQRYQSYNERFAQWFDVNAAEVLGKTVREFLGEKAYEITEPHLTIAYAGKQEQYEMMAPSKMNEARWLHIVYTPNKNEAGKVLGLIVHATDITQSKRVEKALRESEARLRSIIEEAPIATCLFTGRNMVIEIANSRMIDVWGKGNAVIGKPLAQALPELEGQHFLPLLDELFLTGKSYETKGRQADLEIDGVIQTFYFNYSFKPIRNADGEVYAIMEMAEDVTPEVLAKKALEQSEQNLRNIILQAPVALCIFKGKDYVIEVANNSMFKFWGKPAQEVMYKPLFDALPEAKNQGYEDLLARVLNTGSGFSANELPVTLPRGGKLATIYINFAYEPIRDTNGAVSGIMAMATEVTEQVLARKQIEELVTQRTEQLAETNSALIKTNNALINSNINLEQFGYAASHDMQEPLRKIQTFINLLEDEGTDQLTEKGKMLLSKVRSSANRMQTLTDDLLKYSNQKSGDQMLEKVNLNAVVMQVKNDLELIIEQNNVEINVAKLPVIMAVPSQINQLFYNLISNSVKFAKKDAPAKIDITSRPFIPNEEAAGKSLNQDKNYIQISFTDNGIGFEPEYAEKIFQLFTRLHGRNFYQGSGIGLGLCKKIVESHYGEIYAVSQLGKGATFNVILPLDLGM